MDVQRDGDPIRALDPSSTDLREAQLERLTGRVVGWYALGAGAWIVTTDVALWWLRDRDRHLGQQVAGIGKGLLFVVITSTILFAVLRHLTGAFDRMFASTVTAQRDFYGAVLAMSSDAIVIFDDAGHAIYANETTSELLGWSPHELIGRRGQELVHPDDRAAALGFRDAASRHAAGRRTFLLQHRDGSFRAMEAAGAPITLSDGRPGLVINARDVTDRERSERQLRAALAEDATGLPNLRMFLAEMEGLDELRPEGLAATVALVDIDRFSSINDLHGRLAGDIVLRELAQRLEAAVPEALGVWRHGADEFVLVVLDEADGDGPAPDPQVLAERIQAEVASPVVLDERGTRTSVHLSVGVAVVPLGSCDGGSALSTTLLQAAEAAVEEAKRHPDRNAVHLMVGSGGVSDRARLVAELRDAIDHGQLVVHYQPKVRLSDLRVFGIEALVRWEHPERGLLMPGDFLPAVEEGNLSAAVTRTVLRDALACTAGWLDVTGRDPDFAVCVNISLDDLRRRHFASDVFAALDEAGVEPRRLGLELTEQAMLADPRSARAVVDELRREGIQIAIDDFGTGYSTLEHIRVFEVDEIKIDKGFVQRLGSSPADEAIVDSVLAITHRIGVRVVAEGIETAETLGYLRERGCGLGQGYLFSRPVPAHDIDPCATYGRSPA
jgi:PAS domain S-box-containing protein/diguanylate cyclase (GGDEF)-like protein